MTRRLHRKKLPLGAHLTVRYDKARISLPYFCADSSEHPKASAITPDGREEPAAQSLRNLSQVEEGLAGSGSGVWDLGFAAGFYRGNSGQGQDLLRRFTFFR